MKRGATGSFDFFRWLRQCVGDLCLFFFSSAAFGNVLLQTSCWPCNDEGLLSGFLYQSFVVFNVSCTFEAMSLRFYLAAFRKETLQAWLLPFYDERPLSGSFIGRW